MRRRVRVYIYKDMEKPRIGLRGFGLFLDRVDDLEAAHPFPEHFRNDDRTVFELTLLNQGGEDAAGG